MKKQIFSFCLTVSVFFGAFAYNSPYGGETFFQLVSPMALSGGTNSTTGGARRVITPVSILANPALAATEKRMAFDLAYTAAPILGDIHDYAQAVSAGAMIPTPWGVFSGGFAGVFSDVAAMPLKSPWCFYTGFSRDFSKNFHFGFGLLGGGGASWALNGSLGIVHFIPLGFVKDFRYGVSLVNLGRNFSQKFGWGVAGAGELHYPGIATLRAGAAGTLLDFENFSLGLSLDLSFPSFQNFVLDVGLGMTLANLVIVRSNVQLNAREVAKDRLDLFPSVCVGCKFKINTGKSQFFSKKGYDESELLPAVCCKTFSEGEEAISAGATFYLGLEDTDGPEIYVGE